MKTARQDAIIEMIGNYCIETQEEIALRLREKGYQVTQATVSRDIKELKLLKIPARDGGYQYALPEKQDASVNDRLIRMLTDSLVSVNYAGNMIVAKTLSGSANIAAEALDNMEWPELLGTIAGDNTVFMVIRSETEVIKVTERIDRLIKNSI